MALTAKQKLFADEWLVDMDATNAYRRAGYQSKGVAAESNSSRLLANQDVQAYIAERMREREKRTEITQDYVLTTIKNTIDRCAQAEPVVDREGNPTGEYRFDATNVLKGAELLGKHLGMFKEKVELTGKNGDAIKTESTVTLTAEEAYKRMLNGGS